MKKKLLFNITEDWFFCSHFLERALAAKKSGYSVYVCANKNNHEATIKSHGIKFIYVPYNRKSINPIKEFLTIIKILNVYNSINPDIVHQVAAKPIIYGSFAAKFCNIRSVLNAPVGMGYVFTSETIKAKILKPILKILMQIFLNTHNGKNRRNKVVFENNDDLNYFASIGAVKIKDTVLEGMFYSGNHYRLLIF